MPDTAAKGYYEGYGFKTSHMAGFEKELVRAGSYIYFSCFACFFNRASRWMQMQIIIVKKEYRFWCGCPCHEDGNHLTPGYLPFRRKCGYCRFPYTPPFPAGQGYRGGCSSPVLYRRSVHKGRKNIFPYRDRNPLCRRQGGSTI